MTEKITIHTQYPVGSFVMGILFLGNPLYIGAFTIYPSDGLLFIPFHSALITVIGLLLIGTGLESLHLTSNIGTPLSRITAFSLISFIIIEGMLIQGVGGPLGFTPEYGFRRSIFAAMLLVLFLSAGSIRSNTRHNSIFAFGLGILSIGLGLVTWQFDPLLGPLVDLWFLFTGNPILGIPYFGLLGVLGVVVFGFIVGSQVSSN